MKTLELLVKEKMEKEKLSLREAATEMGISHSTLDRMLHGGGLSIDNFVKVSKWLGVNPSTILAAESGKESDVLAAQVAALVEADPELKKIFQEAMLRLLSEEIEVSEFRDLVRYAVWRLGDTSKQAPA